jgi:peptidoglycan hydrolase CwlO-like protein
MSVPIRVRRPLVVLGVVLSLFVGAATIRAAAVWTAASSPLGAKPPSIESLQAALANEQARSAALQAQLDQLAAGSADLTGAINAARERITNDAAQADGLRTSLKAAKAKLASLEASIRRARVAPGTGSSVNAPAPRAVVRSGEVDHEVGDGG